ncbi:MAG: hypothetical protein ACFFAS_14650 [Promethearchaeota archaeon]
MIAKPTQYIGPRAIFDPCFIPPQLLFRKKEEYSLFSLLRDSLSDNYNINVIFQGIHGIGKKVFVQKVVADSIDACKEDSFVRKLCVDCKEKNLEDIILSILGQILEILGLTFDLKAILESTPSRLWTLFKLACKKLSDTIIIILNNIEHLEPESYKKLLSSTKELNISIVSTVNKILRPSTIDILPEFDYKKKLRFFSYNELNAILKQRASLTFKNEIDKDVIDFITDFTFEHHVPVPGKGIAVFRECYPFLRERSTIDLFEMLDVCRSQFDSFGMTDDFGMLAYLSEEDILTIIFLDNLTDYFLKKGKFYISSGELRALYDVACESLQYKKSDAEYDSLVKKFANMGIISTSRNVNQNSHADSSISSSLSLGMERQLRSKRILNNNSYFMIICPNQLKSIVDVVFGHL